MANTIYFNALIAEYFNINFVKTATDRFNKKLVKCRTKKDVQNLVDWIATKYPNEVLDLPGRTTMIGGGFI